MKNVIGGKLITETRLRQIIQEELERKYLIEEGLWNDVKDGVKKLSDFVSQKFKSVAAEWASTIDEKIKDLSTKSEDLNVVMQAIKQGMQETGESIPLDETLKLAQGFSKENVLAAVENDLAGPVHDTAQQLQKGKALGEVYSILTTNDYVHQQKIIKEMGPETILGFGLAVVGGLPLLFKGLHKLASYLKAEKVAELFEKAEHISHAIEEKVIDYAIPDRLSYVIYKFLNKKGYHVSDKQELLTFDQFKLDADKTSARKKTEGLVYKALLIYFAINGLIGVLKAGASLLGFVEGGATAVKGVELARGAEEVAKIVRAAEVGTAGALASRAATAI
jgi:hypothetical protein